MQSRNNTSAKSVKKLELMWYTHTFLPRCLIVGILYILCKYVASQIQEKKMTNINAITE